MSSHEELHVKPATPDDVATLLRFIKELVEYEGLSEELVATEDDIRDSFFGHNPNAEAVFAYCAGQPVGVAVFSRRFSSFSCRLSTLYLEDIFVLSEWRSHGVGRKLMAYASGLAQEYGCSMLEWQVLNWNEPAIKFYEGLGADRVKDRFTYQLTGNNLRNLNTPSGLNPLEPLTE